MCVFNKHTEDSQNDMEAAVSVMGTAMLPIYDNFVLKSWLRDIGKIRRRQYLRKLKSSLQDLGLPKQDVRRGLLQLASKPQVVLKRISTPKHGLINLKKEEKNSRVPPTDWRDDTLALGTTHSKLEESKKDTETNNSKENCDTNRSSLENYSKENKRKSMSPKSSTKHSAKKTLELLSRVTHDASKDQSHLHPFDKDLAKLDKVVLNRYKKDENTKEKPCHRKMTPSVLKSILPPGKVPATLKEVSKVEKKLSTSDRKCDVRKNIKRRECLQSEINSGSNTRIKDSENAVSELLLDNVGPEMYEAHIHGKHNHIKINLSLGPPFKSCDSSKSDHYSGRNMKKRPYYKPTDSTNIPDTTTDERSTMDVITGANKIQIATDQISLDITTMPVSFSDCTKDNEKNQQVGISKSHKNKDIQRKRPHKVILADSSVKKQRTSSLTTDVSSDVNNWKKKKKIWRKLRECFGELISVSEEEEEEKLWPRKRRRKHSSMSNDSGVSALGRNVTPTTSVEVLKKLESLHKHTLAKDINSENSFDTIMYSKERLDSEAEGDRSIKRVERIVKGTELSEIRSDTSELLINSERGDLKNNDAEVEIRESQIVNSNSIVEECATSKLQDVVSSEATVKAETEIKNTTTDLLKQIETQSNDEHVVSSSQDTEILELTEVSDKHESLESKEELIELLHLDLTKTCQIVSEGNVLSLSEKETIGRNEEHLKEDKTSHNTEETLSHDVCNHVQKNNVEVTTPVTKQKADTTLRDMPSLAEEFFVNVPLSEDCNSVAVETPTVADTQITVNPSPECTYGKLRVRTSAELGSRWCPTPAHTPSYSELPSEILPSSISSSTESLNQKSTMIHSSMPKSKSIQNPLDTASGGNVTKGTNVQNVTNLRNYKSTTSSGKTVSQQVINLNPRENGQEGLPRENGLQGQKPQGNIPSNFIIQHEPSTTGKNPYRITVSIPLVPEVSYHAEKNKNGIAKSAAGTSDCYPSSSQGTKTVRQDSIQTASSTVQQSSSITNGPPKNYLSQTAAGYLPRTITDYTPYQLNNNNLNNNNLSNNNLNHNNLNHNNLNNNNLNNNNLNNNNLNNNNLNHNNLNNNNLNHNNVNKTQIRHTMSGQQSGKTLVQVPTMQTSRPVPNDLYKYILCQQTQNAHLAASLTNNPNRPEMQNIYAQEFRHWTQQGISQVTVPPNNRIQQESVINYAGGLLIIPNQRVQVISSSASSVGTTNRTVMRQNVNLRNPNHSQTLISNQMTMNPVLNPVQYLSTIPSNNVSSFNAQATQQIPNNACGNQTMPNISQWGTRFQQNLTNQQVPVRNQQSLMAEQQVLMRNQQAQFMKPQPAMLQPVVQQPNYVNLNQTMSQPNLVKPAEQANVQSLQGIAPVSQSQDQRVPYTGYNTEKTPVLRTGFDRMPSNIVNQNLVQQNNQNLNRYPSNIGNCISEKGYTPECLQQQKSSSETNAGNESSVILPSGKEKTKFEVLNALSFKQRLELVRQTECSLIHFLSLYKYMTVEQSSEIFSSTPLLIEMKNVIEKNLKDIMQDCYRELPGDQNVFDTTMNNVENKGNSCTEKNTSSVQKSSDTQLNDEAQGSFDKVSRAEHEEMNKDKGSLNIAINDQEKSDKQKKAETGDPLPDATTSGDNTEIIGKEIVSSVEKSIVPEKNKNSLAYSNYNCTQQSQEEINTLRALYQEQIDDSLSPLGSPHAEISETSPSTTETEETLGDLRELNTSNSTCTIVINQKEDTVVDTSLSTDINSPKSEECEKNDYSLTEEALSETTNNSSFKEESSDVEDTQSEDTSISTNDNTIILNVVEDSKDLKPNIRDVSIEDSDSSEKTIIKISSDLDEESSDTDKKVVVSETNAYIYGESSKETYFKEIDNTKTDMCSVISDEESSSNETLIFDSVDENSSNTVIPSSVSHTDSNVELCEITENKSDIDLHLENSDYLSSPDILIADVRSIPVHRFDSMDEKEISDLEEENEIVIEEIKSEKIDSESDQDVQEKINEHCLNCEKPSSVVCERCLQAHYCSKRCSDLKWESHYQECQPYNAHTKHF